MSDWSDHAMARLQQQREEQKRKDEKALQQTRIKKALGLGLWREVKQLTIENGRAFNAKAANKMLVFDIMEDTELSIRSNVDGDARRLHATFDDGLSRMSWECGTKSGQWDVAATDEGGVRFEWGTTATTPAAIAEQMLDALLFG